MAPRVQSLPDLRSRKAMSRSPLADAQILCTADCTKRRTVKEAVKGMSVRVVSDRRMRFASAERGLVFELANKDWKPPPKPLPPLHEILRSAVQELNLEFPDRDPNEAPTRKAERGEVKKLGPQLPLRRPRLKEIADGTPEMPPDTFRRSASLKFGETSPGSPKSPEAKKPAAGERSLDPGPDAKTRHELSSKFSKEKAEAPKPKETTPEEADLADAQKLDEDLPFPWSEDELRSVFGKFDHDTDGEVNTDELPAIMRYIGARIEDGDCERLVKELTQYATLSYDEFIEFLSRFRLLDVQRLRSEFMNADKDGSHTLDFHEIFRLLHKCNYGPTSQSVMEAMEAADKDQNGCLDFFEFEALVSHLRRTEGMTLADVEELRTLYDRSLEHSDASEPLADAVWHITVFLGYSAAKEEIAKISAEVDADGSGEVSFEELLKIVRNVRDKERKAIKRVVNKYGENDHVAIEVLGVALNALGYFVTEECVFEILDALGELEDEDYLTLDELAAFLRQYRKTEGFTKKEMEELQTAFERNARKETHALRTLEAGRVLRWFGFTKTVQEVQQIVSSIDFDNSGELELNEFVKLMRRMHQEEAKERHKIFESMKNPNTGEVPVKKLDQAMAMLEGCEPDERQVRVALRKTIEQLGLGSGGGGGKKKKAKKEKKEKKSKKKDKEEEPEEDLGQEVQFFDMEGFEGFFRNFRDLAVAEVHKNVGYSAKEVRLFRNIFKSYDKDGGGTIARSELIAVLSEYFPESTKSKEGQKKIEYAISQVDQDGNCELDFDEFLRLMRICDDQRDADDLATELEVVKECGYTSEEVEGFRQVFSQHVNWAGELPLDVVMESIMSQIMDYRDNEEAELWEHLCRTNSDRVRFPGFLRLLKRVTEENVCDIQRHSTRVIAQDAKRKAAKGG